MLFLLGRGDLLDTSKLLNASIYSFLANVLLHC